MTCRPSRIAALTASLLVGLAMLQSDVRAQDQLTAAAATRARAQLTEHVARGEVTGISDGDTLFLQVEGAQLRVRLAKIDAPEKKQAFGRRSEQSLRELVWKRVVTAKWHQVDRYGRPIAEVFIDQFDVNAEQVRRGMAWVYRAYSRDPDLIRLELEARAERRGLWSEPNPVAPWVWRKQHVTAGDGLPS
jgi:endonuclease YncB( thermonuclease family)